MSTVIAKNVQVGTSGTPAQNFTVYQPASPDGTVRVGNGNSGSVTDLLTLNSSGNLGLGTSSPSQLLHLAKASASDVYVRFQNSNNSNFFIGVQGSSGDAMIYNVSNGPMRFFTNDTERMRLDASGRLAVGATDPQRLFDARGAVNLSNTSPSVAATSGAYADIHMRTWSGASSSPARISVVDNWMDFVSTFTDGFRWFNYSSNGVLAERARIDSNGNLLVGKTTTSTSTAGAVMEASGTITATRAELLFIANRLTTDGTLILFRQDNTDEGSISVSGTTVSYNGGHLSRWAQTTIAKDESLVKGTVLSNLDEMNVYTDEDGNPVDNEQLNKVKVSDVEGDANVAGVFVNWTHDDAHNVDEINMAMTGDMIIRIAAGTTVARGDLLMSAGDGTAKPQGDDIVRSKTVAKVTSTHVTCTYADGSYCVPCVLMAC